MRVSQNKMFLVQTESKKTKTSRIKLGNTPAPKDNLFLVKTKSKETKTKPKTKTTRKTTLKVSPKILHETETLPETTSKLKEMTEAETKIKKTKTGKTRTIRETTPKVSPKIIHETTTEILPKTTFLLKEMSEAETKSKETKTGKPRTTRETTQKFTTKIIRETTPETLPETTSPLKKMSEAETKTVKPKTTRETTVTTKIIHENTPETISKTTPKTELTTEYVEEHVEEIIHKKSEEIIHITETIPRTPAKPEEASTVDKTTTEMTTAVEEETKRTTLSITTQNTAKHKAHQSSEHTTSAEVKTTEKLKVPKNYRKNTETVNNKLSKNYHKTTETVNSQQSENKTAHLDYNYLHHLLNAASNEYLNVNLMENSVGGKFIGEKAFNEGINYFYCFENITLKMCKHDFAVKKCALIRDHHGCAQKKSSCMFRYKGTEVRMFNSEYNNKCCLFYGCLHPIDEEPGN